MVSPRPGEGVQWLNVAGKPINRGVGLAAFVAEEMHLGVHMYGTSVWYRQGYTVKVRRRIGNVINITSTIKGVEKKKSSTPDDETHPPRVLGETRILR